MAWLGKVSLGGFPDLAGAVTKLSESVKNIEKNFDSALGLEEKSSANDEASGSWASASDSIRLFEPVMAFMGHKGDGGASEISAKTESPTRPLVFEEHKNISNDESPVNSIETTAFSGMKTEDLKSKSQDFDTPEKEIPSNESGELNDNKGESTRSHLQTKTELAVLEATDIADSVPKAEDRHGADGEVSVEASQVEEPPVTTSGRETPVMNSDTNMCDATSLRGSHDKDEAGDVQTVDEASFEHSDVSLNAEVIFERELSGVSPVDAPVDGHANNIDSIGSIQPQAESSDSNIFHQAEASNSISFTESPAEPAKMISHDSDSSSKAMEMRVEGIDSESSERKFSTGTANMDPSLELERLKQEMKMMETALQGAARQAQAKADEIARLMNDNELLKSTVEDLKRRSTEAEVDALREEYHQRVSSLERKVYAITRERDALRREQSKKSDAAALLKEKDEIISQVMAEGEELSKKQAAQEATIRKLRAQMREFEEEKQRLHAKLQAEETKVESIKRDKAATEKLLQETIERNQAEIAAQKEFYMNALNAAKEAEALAEARVNSEAKIELESRLKEASEREALLVQTLEELRQTLSRTEQQAVFKEEMLRRDIEDLQKRYQASELRYNELVTQVPESTRPLLRQIEAIQESAVRRAEAWAGVEKTLNSRLQEAEAKAAAAEEKERALNERLSQNISRITVLETQITCLRTEQTQLSRSLEKERQRATKSGQDYLAAVEEAATQEGRAKQFEDEIKELRIKHKKELQEEATHRELLEKELERVKAAKAELEKSHYHETHVVNQSPTSSLPIRKLVSAGSLNNVEDNTFLRASLDSSDNFFSERRISSETTLSPYFLKTMTQSAFEAALRQKDGELASYMSRLASLESIRDSLAEELVKMTEECEKLRAEAAALPGLRAELEALRQRHSAALELMGERDEELEELRADIVDMKEMYREQVDLLVNRIQKLSASTAVA